MAERYYVEVIEPKTVFHGPFYSKQDALDFRNDRLSMDPRHDLLIARIVHRPDGKLDGQDETKDFDGDFVCLGPKVPEEEHDDQVGDPPTDDDAGATDVAHDPDPLVPLEITVEPEPEAAHP